MGSKPKKTLIALAAVVAVAVVAVLIAGVGGASADEVRFQNVSDPGPKPFTPPTDVPKASSRSAASGASSSSSSSSSGSSSPDTPGSTGSSTASSAQSTVCDREKLIAALAADPAKLSAFADAVGTDAEAQAVGDYIRKLRPVTLTRDTQVTSHFYSDGSAEPYQAILPKGTAALVDEGGKPIVRCRSGSPLAEPVELEKQTKCVNCPPNYQPPPPCEGKCYRPDRKAPGVKKIGTKVKVDPIATAKTELEKCRKDKGGLEQCKTEYEKARQQCAASPFNPACDASVCFDQVDDFFFGSSDGCGSYISDGDITNYCSQKFPNMPDKVACQKKLTGTQKRCGADPAEPGCMLNHQDKAFVLRQQCTGNGERPECKVVQVACAKDPQSGCEALQKTCLTKPDRADCKALGEFKQTCSKNPTRPECKDLPRPKAADPTLKNQAPPDDQEGDQGPGAEGTGQEPGGGQAPETGGETPQPENPAPQPENPSPPEGE